ncbi:MAG: hypothetical protein KatS3mg023_3026 [Armatimonadota bacterium]|nr:MAG: hypothetical protein KatS3mg023_3026 [Armatimonadota bacterium]
MDYTIWLGAASAVIGWFVALLSFASWYRERRGLAGYGKSSAFRNSSLCLAIGNSFVLLSICWIPDLYVVAAFLVTVASVWALLIMAHLDRKGML